MAKILEFPSSRVSLEVIVGEAKILKMPERKQLQVLYWGFVPVMFWFA